MNKWAADWANNYHDDCNLILEIHCDSKDVAVIKQSQQGLILQWYVSPNGLTMPVDWFSGLLLAGKRDLVDPTTNNEEIHISQWTSERISESHENNFVHKVFCDDEDVATIKQSQQGLVLSWHSTPKGLIMPVDWLSELLLEVIRSATGAS